MCTGRGAPRGEPGERVGDGGGGLLGGAHAATPVHQLIHGGAGVLGFVQLAEVAALGSGRHAG